MEEISELSRPEGQEQENSSDQAGLFLKYNYNMLITTKYRFKPAALKAAQTWSLPTTTILSGTSITRITTKKRRGKTGGAILRFKTN